MTLVQPVLVCLLLVGVTIYFRRLRSRLVDRIVAMLILIAALVLIAFPEWANFLAHQMGVGRGVDFLFYLAIPGLGFMLLLLFSKVLQLETQICELSREMALRDALEVGQTANTQGRRLGPS